eukprot:gene10094-7063_t
MRVAVVEELFVKVKEEVFRHSPPPSPSLPVLQGLLIKHQPSTRRIEIERAQFGGPRECSYTTFFLKTKESWMFEELQFGTRCSGASEYLDFQVSRHSIPYKHSSTESNNLYSIIFELASVVVLISNLFREIAKESSREDVVRDLSPPTTLQSGRFAAHKLNQITRNSTCVIRQREVDKDAAEGDIFNTTRRDLLLSLVSITILNFSL